MILFILLGTSFLGLIAFIYEIKNAPIYPDDYDI